MTNLTSREVVMLAIDVERQYQQSKWSEQESVPLPPSDEIRLIQHLINEATNKWYVTKDSIVDGHKVNPADLDAMRKIAACAVRCMENWGVMHRQC